MLTVLLVALVAEAATEPRVTLAIEPSSVTVTVERAAVNTVVAIPDRVMKDGDPETLHPTSVARKKPARGAEVVTATFDRPRTDFWIDITLMDGNRAPLH